MQISCVWLSQYYESARRRPRNRPPTIVLPAGEYEYCLERVIERAVKSVAESHDRWEATGQAHTTNLISGTPTVNMYPDFAVSNVETETDDGDETVVVGDAKWQTGSVSNDDIYQLTSHVLARKAPGLVCYPAQDGAAEREYQQNDGN